MNKAVASRNLSSIYKSACSVPARKLGETLLLEKGVEFTRLENNEYHFSVIDYYGEKLNSHLKIVASKKGEIESCEVFCDCLEEKNGKPTKICSHLWAVVNYFDQQDLLEAEFKELNSSLHHFLKELSEKARKKSLEVDEEEAPTDPYPFYIFNVNASRKYLCISLVEKVLKKTGEWGKPKPLQDIDLRLAKISYPEDIDALQMVSSSSVQNNIKGFNFKHIYQHKVLSILDVVERTGRAFYVLNENEEPLPLEIDLKRPWSLTMNFHKIEDVFVMTMNAVRGDELLPMVDLSGVFGVDEVAFFHNGRYMRFHRGTDRKWVDAAIETPECHFDEGTFKNLMSEIRQYEFTPCYSFSPSINVQECDASKMIPILRLHFDQYISGRLSFEYENEVEFTEFESTSDFYDVNKNMHIKRDRNIELGFKFNLEKLGFEYKGGVWLAPAVDLLDKVNSLIEKGWKILANQDKPIKPYNNFTVKVSSGIDWLNLEVGLIFNDRVYLLPEILKAYRKNSNFIVLDDGTFGMLPSKWLDKHFKVLDFGEMVEKEHRLKFSKAHALMIEEMLKDVEQKSQDEAFLEICSNLRNFTGVEQIDQPKELVGSLRKYQLEGLRWMNFLNQYQLGGCLADDMGLGKTIQTISLLLNEKKKNVNKPSLIILPTSIVFNWRLEIQKFAPSLTFLSYIGPDRQQLSSAIRDVDVVLTTYGIIRRDCLELSNLEFHYVILDEAQAIKNSDSQTAKSIKMLRSTFKLSMTGTPIENNISELWSQFEFLLPGFLGSRDHFLKSFHRKSIDDPDIDLAPLKALIKPFLMRRTKDEVVTDLPEKVEQVLYCEMEDKQKAKYNELMEYYRAKLLDKTGQAIKSDKNSVQILEALMALRQMCCHPELLVKAAGNDSIDYHDSAKMETLMNMLEEICAEDHKALVFSQFTSMLAIIRKWLDEVGIPYCYLDGAVPLNKRQEEVERFQNDKKYKIFLISLKAGGVGLNLTAADYVFIYDPWWNPAVEAQAVDRTHRIGQTKQIFTYRLITKDTIEEKVHALQANKRQLVKDVIDDTALPSTFNKKDLHHLFF